MESAVTPNSQQRFILYNLPLRSTDTPPQWTNWDMAVGMKRLLERYGVAGTWLPRFDALNDPRYVELCRGLDSRQELGVWLEITASHARAANVPYDIPPGEAWYWANHALTMGYTQEERRRLIDVIMARFHELFGRYPKVVAMWMLDSYAAEYLHENYGIAAIGLCRNQYGIDGYTLWGGWPNLPFWPAREYLWQPAATPGGRAQVIVYPIISEDLVADYGNEKGIWSTEVATIQMLHLPESIIDDYHNRLVDHCLESGQPIGLASFVAENSWDWARLSNAYEKQISHLARLQSEGRAQSVTVNEFASWYAQAYPEVSPSQVWYQPSGWANPFPHSACIMACTKRYRARLRTDYDGHGLLLTDLRVYDENQRDPYWEVTAKERFARWIIPFVLDSARFARTGERTGPWVDVAENAPMAFRLVALPGETSPERISQRVAAVGKMDATPGESQEQLRQVDTSVFHWSDQDLEAEWRFTGDGILITASPQWEGEQVALALECNPRVLNLTLLADGRAIPLTEANAANCYGLGQLELVNATPEGAGAALCILLQNESKKLICRWEPEESSEASGAGRLLVYSGAPVLGLRLLPHIAGTNKPSRDFYSSSR